MGLTSFSKFQKLLSKGHYPNRMGLRCKAGDINEFANRVRLAREFQGLNLPTYSEETVLGYNALFQVFLTHSALERFREIFLGKDAKESDLSTILGVHNQDVIIEKFLESDPDGQLYEFLYLRLNPYLQKRLKGIKNGSEKNVAFLSAAIRHIFVHGHLTAHANGSNPRRTHEFCCNLSDFLLEVMDLEFTKTIEAYCEKKNLVL